MNIIDSSLGFIMNDRRLDVGMFLAKADLDAAFGQMLESFRNAGLMVRVDAPRTPGWIYILTTTGKDFMIRHVCGYVLGQMKQMVEEDPQMLAILQKLLDREVMKDEDQEEAKIWN